MSENQEQITRAYVRLNSLKDNLPNDNIKENYVNDYHDIVTVLEKTLNINLSEFKIPANEVKHRQTSSILVEGDEDSYSEDKYCEKSFFLMKIDALISYFSIKYLSKEEPKIGFNPLEK